MYDYEGVMLDADDIALEFMAYDNPLAAYRDSLASNDHVWPYQPPATMDSIHVLPWANENAVVS